MSGTVVDLRDAVVRGRRVPFRVAGAGSPIVLVHGLAGSTRWWSRNLAALAAHHRVYLVDLPGFGALRRHRERFVLGEAACWLRDWLAAVKIGPVDLVGHSMGGAIAAEFAASHPDAVRRLVLVAPAGLPLGRSLPARLPGLAAFLRHTTPRFLPILALDALRADPGTLWRATRDVISRDVRSHLGAIAAPTLLVWGEHDTLVPTRLAPSFRDAIPGARLLILPGAGHVPMFDRPADFNRAILAFLAGATVGE